MSKLSYVHRCGRSKPKPDGFGSKVERGVESVLLKMASPMEGISRGVEKASKVRILDDFFVVHVI